MSKGGLDLLLAEPRPTPGPQPEGNAQKQTQKPADPEPPRATKHHQVCTSPTSSLWVKQRLELPCSSARFARVTACSPAMADLLLLLESRDL